MPSTRSCIALIFLATLAPASAGQAETITPLERSRIYLLGNSKGHTYWSVDAQDPELQTTPLVDTFTTGPTPNVSRTYQMFFMPASLIDERVELSPSRPLRFHLELTTSQAASVAVHLALQQDARSHVLSPAATEVSPGVFEGTFTQGTLGDGDIDQFSIALVTSTPYMVMEVKAAGATYIDLPDPVAARSVPDLLRASPTPTVPGVYQTAQRRFEFNDDAWTAKGFEGDLTATRSFEMEVPRDAAFVIGWVEVYDSPVIHDVANGRTVEPRKVTDFTTASLSRDSVTLDSGPTSAAELRVPAGPITLTVTPSSLARGASYTAHILAVHGERTLSSMRWMYRPSTGPAASVALVATCANAREPVPTTGAVRTFTVAVRSDSPNPASRWSLSYELPGVGSVPCGKGRGDIRFTVPGERMWVFTPVPDRGAPMVSLMDTTLELEVRFAHEPEVVVPAP